VGELRKHVTLISLYKDPCLLCGRGSFFFNRGSRVEGARGQGAPPAVLHRRYRHRVPPARVDEQRRRRPGGRRTRPSPPSYAEPKSRSSTRRLSMHCHRCTCVVIKKLASYSCMREDVRAPPRGAHKNKCIYVQMPYHYKRMKLSADGLPVGLLRPSTPRLLVALLGRGSSPSSTRRRSRRAASIRHLLSSRPSGLHQREGERQRRGASGSWSTFACSSSTTTSARPLAERRPPHRRRLLWLGRRQSGGTPHHRWPLPRHQQPEALGSVWRPIYFNNDLV